MTSIAIHTDPTERGLVHAQSAGLLPPWASRVADLVGLVTAIAAGVATLIAVIGYQNAVMQDKIMAAVNPLTVAIVEMDKRLTGQLGALDKRLDQVDGRLDRMDHRLDRMDHRFERVETRLGSVEQRLSGLESSVTSVNSRLGRLEGKVGK